MELDAPNNFQYPFDQDIDTLQRSLDTFQQTCGNHLGTYKDKVHFKPTE